MTLKVYVPRAQNLSHAMTRVERALVVGAPTGVRLVADPAVADVVVFHVVGFPDTLDALSRLQTGQRYVLAQYCLKSTQRPDPQAWLGLWRHAVLVWSYYDLAEACRRAGVADDLPFYRSPLGVDGSVFRTNAFQSGRRRFGLVTSGYVAETEGVLEGADACLLAGREHFHLGPRFPEFTHNTRSQLGISDESLASVYRNTDYVAGLRRVEGFELPAAEGLLCGARPICFDRPHYRDWFGEWARFVPEADAQTVKTAILEILKEEVRPVTEVERELAATRFSWAIIIKGFWDRVLERA